MATQTATIIIEPRSLVREALESFMANHSYSVVCSVDRTSSIASPAIAPDGAKLVLLCIPFIDQGVSEAAAIRKLWPDSKIVLLFESISIDECRELIASQVDACVQLSVSRDTLINTLDLVMSREVRVMIMGITRPSSPSLADVEESHQAESSVNRDQIPCARGAAVSPNAMTVSDDQLVSSDTTTTIPRPSSIVTSLAPSLRSLPKLSEREVQILDGLVKGHANKVIARACDITEATVKVHMKSILRKIRVANRTQAAIWALEHGFFDQKAKSGNLNDRAKQPSVPMM